MLAYLISIFGPLLLAVVINLCGAVVNTGGPSRRALGVCLGLACMLPAWLVPREHTLIRGEWVVLTFMGAARNIDLARGRWSLGERVAHVLSVVDTRRLKKAAPRFEPRPLLQAALWELGAWASFQAIPLASRYTGAAFWGWRWLFALVFIYALSQGAYCFAEFAYRAAGFVTPPLHIAPAAARSVQEFWGERWNRIVSTWLGETFFRPLARRRHPALGAFVAFLVSALLHAYIEWVAIVSWGLTLVMLGFFLAQAVVIALERILKVRAWLPWAGHAWTIAWLVALSPMFSEPALWCFGI